MRSHDGDSYSYASGHLSPPEWNVSHIAQVLDIDDVWKDGVWTPQELSDWGEIEFQGLMPSFSMRSAVAEHGQPEFEHREAFDSLHDLIRIAAIDWR